jgi:hypothetical protein
MHYPELATGSWALAPFPGRSWSPRHARILQLKKFAVFRKELYDTFYQNAFLQKKARDIATDKN